MKVFRVLLVSIVVLFTGVAASALPIPKGQRAKYEALAAQVRGGNLDVDWRALRLAAELSGVEGSYDPASAYKQGIAACKAGKYGDALRIAQAMEQHNIADGNAHSLAAIALEHMGRSKEVQQERDILDAFFRSIIKSGDGKGADTAYFTVNTREESLVMRQLLLVTPQSHTLAHVNGHSYDVIAAKNAVGRDVTLWFSADTDQQRAMDLRRDNANAIGSPDEDDAPDNASSKDRE